MSAARPLGFMCSTATCPAVGTWVDVDAAAVAFTAADTKPGDLLADAAAVQAALSDSRIALVVESRCGYPLLLTVDENSTVIAKSPGDDYPVYDDDQCCWPYRVVWAQPGD